MLRGTHYVINAEEDFAMGNEHRAGKHCQSNEIRDLVG